MNKTKLSVQEKTDILFFLSDKETLFRAIVDIGEIFLTEETIHGKKTAWVTFDKEGNFLNFYFNLDFWNSLSFNDRCFIIGHECLHVVLYHGLRMKNFKDAELANKAADLVVNHLLEDRFLFQFEDKILKDKLCWVHTIDPTGHILKNKELTFEEYYDLLYKHQIKLKLENVKCLDAHETNEMSESDNGDDGDQKDSEKTEIDVSEMSKEQTQDFVRETLDKLTNEETDSFSNKVREEDKAVIETYGPNPGTYHETKFHKGNKTKKSWSTIFKKIAKDTYKVDEKEFLQWIRKSRRNSLLPSNLIVPHVVDVEEIKRDKLRIQLYIDFSGSCRNLQKDFWDAYDSIPKKIFDVDLFTVTDYIYPVVNGKLTGSWGNAPFQIIENNIQKMLKEKEILKYPNCVVVFTDGHAGGAKAQFPEKWIWILPRQGSTTEPIQKQSKMFYLDEVMK